MKLDRWYYSAVAGLFIVLMVVGFHNFASGRGDHGRIIDPAMVRIDAIHGFAIAAWFLLFLIQSLLVGTRNRRLHFTLGWSSIAIGLTVFITGSLVAIRSVQIAPPQFSFFGVEYRRFMLMMLVEIWAFTAFLTVGILQRRKPKIHRPAMLLAGLALLSGATARMAFLHPVFGEIGWVGLFGPIFCIGLMLLLVRRLLTRSIDRPFAIGYAVMVMVFIGSAKLAMTDAWITVAAALLKI